MLTLKALKTVYVYSLIILIWSAVLGFLINAFKTNILSEIIRKRDAPFNINNGMAIINSRNSFSNG